jgi:hypothetical protein
VVYKDGRARTWVGDHEGRCDAVDLGNGVSTVKSWSAATWFGPSCHYSVDDIWPLAVGKSSGCTIVGSKELIVTVTITVARQEKINIGERLLDTLVFELRSNRGNWFRSEQTLWYSPELGFNVKATGRLLLGPGSDERLNWEAVSITVPK